MPGVARGAHDLDVGGVAVDDPVAGDGDLDEGIHLAGNHRNQDNHTAFGCAY